jgi:hypothetical protein
MRRRFNLLLALLAFVLAACGGGHKLTPPSPLIHSGQLSKPACDPKPGQGHLGDCVPHQAGIAPNRFRLLKLPANNGLMCDIYEGDSITSYQTLAQHVTGCIFKAYETNYGQDSHFVRSWNAFKALGKWHSAYLFLRAGDCFAQAQAFVNIVNSVGGFNQPNTGPPVVDSEVPSAAQDTACVVARLEHLTHRQVVIYTAPGTWPGGSHGDALEWAAGYGNYTHSPCIWTCLPVAWQFTDGTFGPFPHQLPGYASPGDISVDYGLSRLVAGPPPDIYAKYPTAVIRPWGVSEHQVVAEWDQLRCRVPRHGAGGPRCHHLMVDLQRLAGRIDFVAHNQRIHGHWVALKRPRWSAFTKQQPLGSRRAGIVARLHP